MAVHPRDAMAPVPAGKVRLAEYGAVDPALHAEATVVASAHGSMHGFPVVSLVHSTRGYVPAGSVLRWDEARWSVRYTAADGAIIGQSFVVTNEEAARALFARWTDPVAVSAARQEAARMEDEVYRPAREARRREAEARAEAERARRRAMAAYRRARKKAGAA